MCLKCGAVFDDGRWYYNEQAHKEARKKQELSGTGKERIVCPGCAKIERKEIDGVVCLRGDFVSQHREEILNLIKNEAEKKRRKNIAARIFKITKCKDGMDVELTNHSLAERIGKELERAFSGKLGIQWLKKEQFARVKWEREQ